MRLPADLARQKFDPRLSARDQIGMHRKWAPVCLGLALDPGAGSLGPSAGQDPECARTGGRVAMGATTPGQGPRRRLRARKGALQGRGEHFASCGAERGRGVQTSSRARPSR